MFTASARWGAVGLAGLLLLALVALAPAEDRSKLIRPRPPIRGVLVVQITAVEPSGPAWRAGLEVRDQIREVDGVQITNLAQLRRSLVDAGYSARLTVVNWRTGREATLYVYPNEDGRIGIDARMVMIAPPSRYPY